MEDEKDLIIIVDDSHENLHIAREVLSEKFAVITASSAKRLFIILKKSTPALILLDVDMPDINGYEAIKILKSKPETQDIPVIYLTARADLEDEITGLSLGAVDYITKPFQPALLIKRIGVHLLLEARRKALEKQAIDLQNAILKAISELAECSDDTAGGQAERTKKGIKLLVEAMAKNSIKNHVIFKK